MKCWIWIAATCCALTAVNSRAEESAKDKPAKTFTNTLGIKLIMIPAGEFMMGNAETVESLAKAFPHYESKRIEGLGDEKPYHKVRITKPFYFAVHELTIGQFKEFSKQADFKSEAERDGTGGWGYNRETQKIETRNPKYSWRNPGFAQGDDHPVVNITWNDAVDICRWLSKKEGKKYRLPTEAEWEYACRAGEADTGSRYHFGNDPEGLAKAANTYDATSAKEIPESKPYAIAGDDGYAYTAPVGSYKPNAFGLYDMHGNVWEWCSDFYGEDYYAKSPTDDPKGPETGRKHVRRGGAWASWPLYLRTSFRNWNTPQSRYINLGLRMVCEAE